MSVGGNIKLISKCTGCFACKLKCPTQAINMVLNNEGFYYPVVSEDLCISCDICLKICPALISSDILNTPIHIYSAFAKDPDILQNSSSGGIFGLLANTILADDGIVYGAAFDKTCKEVCHTSTDRTPLSDIMRSKYVQSKVGDIFLDTEMELKKGRSVLFSGTPCQIKGLHAYLDQEYDNLTTVDFMCHGVPSTGFFKDVIDYYERMENEKVVDVSFREKDLGWRNLVVKIYLSDGSVISKKSSDHYYYLSFQDNYSIRKSCLDCSCYNTHEADITLADQWCVKNDDDKGVSLVLVNTENGERCYKAISEAAHTINIEKEFSGYDYYRHMYSSQNRNRFFEFYTKHGFDKTWSGYLRKMMRRKQISKKIGVFKRRIIGILKRPS